MSKIPVKILLDNSYDLPLPLYATEFSSGMDLRANIKEDIIIKANSTSLIHSGIFLEIPLGYEVQIRSRSGLAAKNSVMVLNSPGTIDADYRGEIIVILANLGKEDFVVKRGDRVAQMVLAPVFQMDLIEAESLEESVRGSGKFGSTGR